MIGIFALVLLGLNSLIAQSDSTFTLYGQVLDSLSGQAIPYSNVYVKNTLKGTLTNEHGHFYLKMTQGDKKDTLQFSLMGFEPLEIPLTASTPQPLMVYLTPSPVQLKEAIVLPLEPEDYVKKAIIKMAENFPDTAYNSTLYYREILKENEHYNQYTEALLDVYNLPYSGTPSDTTQIRIKAGKEYDDLSEIEFMQGFAEKQKKKYYKKQKKKGNEVVKSDVKGFTPEFINPYWILDSNLVRKRQMFLDTNDFKLYDYKFSHISKLDDKRVMCIEFDQKDKVRDPLFAGTIYLEEESLAIVALEFHLSEKGKKYLIPGYAKPVMWAMRLKVSPPLFGAFIRNREINGKWYLEYIKFTMDAELTKKYYFDDDHHSRFTGEQILVVVDRDLGGAETFPAEEIALKTKPIRKQLKKDSAQVNWTEYSRIQPPKNLEEGQKQ
ncbi:carboxypeptidase-like regulatory domain-containing protein [bacterium SCSIO 12741]|nr:carboxypeptidase-like regulatory domain-containing protein [bacterium SCSIO 12741]